MNATRRVMQLTKRNIENGMGVVEARKKARERVSFEQEVETECTNMKPMKCNLGGK